MRMQLELSKAKAEQVKDVMALADFNTYAELFNNSFALLTWAIRHVQDGDAIVAYNDRRDTMKELSMPFLHHVADANRESSDSGASDAGELVEVEDAVAQGTTELSAKFALEREEYLHQLQEKTRELEQVKSRMEEMRAVSAEKTAARKAAGAGYRGQ